MGAEGGELGAVHGDGDQLVRAVAVGGLVDRLAEGLAEGLAGVRRQVVAAGPQADDQSELFKVGHQLRGHRHRLQRQLLADVSAQHGGLGRVEQFTVGPHHVVQPQARLGFAAVAGVPVQVGLGAPRHQSATSPHW